MSIFFAGTGFIAMMAIVFKTPLDNRIIGKNDQDVTPARNVSYTAGFPGQLLPLWN